MTMSLLVLVFASPVSRASADALVPLLAHPADLPWPTERWPRGELPPELDESAFETAIEGLFEPMGRGGLHDTRALLVIREGRILYERYAASFGPSSRFQSWSMGKSITHSLVGILIRQGKLLVDAPAAVPAWREPGDPRGDITLDDLLHMTSGLDNGDGFESGGDFIGEALFGVGALNPAAFAANVGVAHPRGTHWAYSTGSTMIVSSIAGRFMGGSERERLAFMRRELFGPLGMRSAVPEFDSAEQFLGGAFFHATARDWARFGYLYLRDGVWEGRRILPEGWADHARRRGTAENNGIHGAHFWINGEPGAGQWTMYPGAPPSAFGAEGNGMQMVIMVPTHDLIVVRLGELHTSGFLETRRLIGQLITSFPPQDPR
jgi:CubicO group peptidase (beta-lactamase class C family)